MRRFQAGLSLIELVMVLIVISVLSASALVRLGTPGSQTVSIYADMLESDIVFTQGLATSWAIPLQLTFSGSSYSVQCKTATASYPCNVSPILNPSTSEPFLINLDNGIAVVGGGFVIDAMGRPRDVASNNILTADSVITLSSGGASWRITTAALTGFVSKQRL
ncbi:MAG: prepilin-type N-terminal cleavage/methylation domain-containing protein [Gammaproteobacteria bacterium]|nr:prepilin-type N-terminal cleavage/methylation domain-containing protein [Gammaproteobacteria bacterium]MDH5693673.1 prepilin-type N-terminal cleavage/methylation domain-containing protein [Gammaproteobacteria bacterium]